MAASTINKNTIYIREVACTIPSTNATKTMSFSAYVEGHSLIAITPKQSDDFFFLQETDGIIISYSISNYISIQIQGLNKNLTPSSDRVITFICVYN